MRDLLGGGASPLNEDISGLDAMGRPFIDVITYHTYPFYDNYTRENLIAEPGGGFKDNLNALKSAVEAINLHPTKRPGKPLKIAITEFNVNWATNSDPLIDPIAIGVWGIGCRSFIAGQFWADMFANGLQYGGDLITSMMPWSIHESGGDEDNEDKGYLGGENGECKRSTYHHYRLMTEYFTPSSTHLATFYPGQALDNNATPQVISDLKVFGVKRDNEHYAIMLMNQSDVNSYSFKADPGGGTVTGNQANISLPLGGCNPFTGIIYPNTTVLMKWDYNCANQGYYSYDVVKAQNCDEPVFVSSSVVPNGPSATLSTTDGNCSDGYMNGSAHVSNVISYNGNGCTINWSTGATTSFVNNLKPGTYWVKIKDIGTTGYELETMYTFVINGEFYMPRGIPMTTSWNSNKKIAGTIQLNSGTTLNINSALIEFAADSKIIVKAGATLNLNQGSVLQSIACPSTWAGIEVQSGGILNLENGSTVKINGSGKIFIHDGGTLNYKQGTSVVLQNNTSVIEIAGQLNIGTNANS